MRHLLLVPLILFAAAACGSDVRSVEGRLAEGVEVTDVWVVGGPEGSAVADGSFLLEDLGGDTLDLRFAREGEELARMEIIGAPAGSLSLRDIWIDEETGTAYPEGVTAEEAGPILVNGLRMGDVATVPAKFEGQAVVLAISRAADAFLARPLDEEMPDLRVVVTPGTLARTVDGEPVSLEELEFGDTIGLRGAAEQGFIVATEVTVPRARAGGDLAGEPDEDSDPIAARAAARGAGSDRDRNEEREREREREREKERERGKEKENKGKGRGRGG